MSNKKTIPLAAAAIACAFTTAAHAAMTISNAKTRNVICASGVCTPTRGNANLNVGELQTMLASSDVTIKSILTAADIGIVDPLTWASIHQLTLDAYESIHVRAPIVVEGTAGMKIITNDGGTGGDYTFNTTTSGSITFWDTTSSLVINGKSYTLVNDIAGLANAINLDSTNNVALARNYDAASDRQYNKSPVRVTYYGAFEGLGNAIANLRIINTEKERNVGLFAQVKGSLRDITLTNTIINGRDMAGSLVGDNKGVISHVLATNSYVVGHTAGGIAGTNTGGVISDSSSSGQVFGGAFSGSGGIVGVNKGGVISADSFSGEAYGETAGGLVGINDGTVTSSFVVGSVEADEAGGLVGHNTGSVIDCWASAQIKTDEWGGGLIGGNFGGRLEQSFSSGLVDEYATNKRKAAIVGGLVGYEDQYSLISSSYALAKVKGRNGWSGGLVGYISPSNNPKTITQSYSAGEVTGYIAGGAVGKDRGNAQLENIYWNLDTSGISNPHQGAGDPLDDPGIAGLTDTQLKSALPAGFDPNIWGQSASINNGWPYLLANPPPQ